MNGLFDKDPVFTQRIRDSKGRFATPEQAKYDKVMRERRWMEFQVEKFKRIAKASTGAYIAQSIIIANQKRIIADLRKELAELKKSKKKC